MNITDRAFLSTVALFIVVAIAATAYQFLIRRDYDVFIEAPCDPDLETCFVRDCSGGECPANDFEYYRMFSVGAQDFATCADSSCLAECTTGIIECAEAFCGESEEDSCSVADQDGTP